MFLLTKAFKLRDQVNDDGHEKPFLEHLEDLRVMVTRIVVTLLVSTLLCYFLKDKLMDVLRKPIETVWEQNQQDKLPDEITPDLWEQAKRASHYSSGLSEEAKILYFEQFENPRIDFYSECAGYYRAAKSIDNEELRLHFIDSLPNTTKAVRDQTKQLLEKSPSVQIDAKNNVVYMRSLKPTETFMLSLKLAFFAGIIVSFPFILVFILQFVLPGLKENEKKALWPAMAVGFGLFLSGVFFCYFLVLPKALEFFYLYSGSMGVENEWRIGEYITFATQFTLIFGLAFELPVVVMTLVKLGLLDYEVMSRTRSYAIVSIFIIAAIITPTGDALTLCMLAAPMCLLYEACIWFAFFTRKKELDEEAAERERLAPRIAAAPGSLAAMEALEEHIDEDIEEELDEHGHNADEGEELDDGVLEEEDSKPLSWADSHANLDALRATYDPDASYEDEFDGEADAEEDIAEQAEDESNKDN